MAIREPDRSMAWTRRSSRPEREQRRRLDSYAQGRPLGRALLESALTVGAMLMIAIAALALRAWYAV